MWKIYVVWTHFFWLIRVINSLGYATCVLRYLWDNFLTTKKKENKKERNELFFFRNHIRSILIFGNQTTIYVLIKLKFGEYLENSLFFILNGAYRFWMVRFFCIYGSKFTVHDFFAEIINLVFSYDQTVICGLIGLKFSERVWNKLLFDLDGQIRFEQLEFICLHDRNYFGNISQFSYLSLIIWLICCWDFTYKIIMVDYSCFKH